MITVRKSEERGHFDLGWLDTYHTFSFDRYHDPAHMHFRSLRVINEDRVQPGQGFPTHSHRDMEIITYILSGSLQHRDNMGNGSVIRPGDVQRMTAGTGVAHSEFNPSKTESVHLLQIWILPRARNLPPGYEQKFFSDEERRGRLRLIASPDGQDGSVKINQDARVYAGMPEVNQSVEHRQAEDQETKGLPENILNLNYSVISWEQVSISSQLWRDLQSLETMHTRELPRASGGSLT